MVKIKTEIVWKMRFGKILRDMDIEQGKQIFSMKVKLGLMEGGCMIVVVDCLKIIKYGEIEKALELI